MGNAAPISRQALLARESRENILRRCKDAAYYRLAERHLGRNIAVKKFISHVPLIIKIADCRGRQPENGHIRIQRKQSFHSPTPHLSAASVKFIKDYVIRLYAGNLTLRHIEQLGICEKSDVRRRNAVIGFFYIFKLSGKDIFRR